MASTPMLADTVPKVRIPKDTPIVVKAAFKGDDKRYQASLAFLSKASGRLGREDLP
jgi:hypothetical protein